MGLFTQRPEENEEWTGLPSEPLVPESPAERLDAPIDPRVQGLFGDSAGTIEISIPIATLGASDGPEAADEPDEG